MTRKSWHLNRREVLRGVGAALALPLLESMSAGSSKTDDPPKRMVVSYFSYGAYMPEAKSGVPDPRMAKQPHPDWSWWPCKEAGPLSFNKSSAPFEPLKDYVSYIQGLDHAGGWKLGGHSSGDVFATGADMTGDHKTNNISIDQLAARVHGHKTRYPSLVLGTEGGTGSYGRCKTLSHYGPGRPIPSLNRPREIFNRLFRPFDGQDVSQVKRDLDDKTSVLDLVLEESKSLKNRLGRNDQAKLDEYLQSVRTVEQRVERTSQWVDRPLPEVDPASLNLEVTEEDPENYIRCMYDLIYLALQTDMTRYISFMLESEQSGASELQNYAHYLFGYSGNTHDISHKRPDDISGRWDNWRAIQHAYLLQRLRDTPEADGNMLDHTVVLWGSAHPHQAHNTKNYPIHLAGGNRLGFRHGHFHKFIGDEKVPLANLFVSMLNAIDVPVDSFADSTCEMTALRRPVV